MRRTYLLKVAIIVFMGTRLFWELVDNHVVEEVKEHDEIGLQFFDE